MLNKQKTVLFFKVLCQSSVQKQLGKGPSNHLSWCKKSLFLSIVPIWTDSGYHKATPFLLKFQFSSIPPLFLSPAIFAACYEAEFASKHYKKESSQMFSTTVEQQSIKSKRHLYPSFKSLTTSCTAFFDLTKSLISHSSRLLCCITTSPFY